MSHRPQSREAAYDISSAGETPRELVLAGDPQFLVVLTGQEKRLRYPEASRRNRGPVPEVARMPTALAGPFSLGEARTGLQPSLPDPDEGVRLPQLADFAGDVSETLGPSVGTSIGGSRTPTASDRLIPIDCPTLPRCSRTTSNPPPRRQRPRGSRTSRRNS